MHQKQRYKYSKLFSIYFNFIFQKSTLIIFLLSIIILSICLLLCSNPGYDKIDYIKYSSDFHLMYFKQSNLIIQIFNSIIVVTFVISITLQTNNFDVLFISYTSRNKIALFKIINISIILFLLIIYELALFLGIGLIFYSDFIPNITTFFSFFGMYIIMMFEFSVCILFTSFIPIILTPMIFLFVFFVIKLLCNNYNMISNFFSKLIPIININQKNLYFEIHNPILCIIWILLLLIIYINIYTIKDLKQ